MIRKLNGTMPDIHPSAFTADSAEIIGEVKIGANSSVWFNAVIRGDLAAISIGAYTNIQDNCTIHVDPSSPCRIGDYVTVGHNAVIHGATIKDGALIGMNATVLNGAVIGEGSIIGAGAVVTENTVIPPRSLALGIPAKVVKPASVNAVADNRQNAMGYAIAADVYKKSQAKNGK